MSYAWTFGDGGTGTGASPTRSYASAGTYTVTLTVTDTDGLTRSASATATITLDYLAIAPACNGTIFKGDVNGDGRLDFICGEGNWPVTMKVSLAHATGFALPATRGSTAITTQQGLAVGDFTGDGKADFMAFTHDTWEGQYYVHASNGTSFAAGTSWGQAMGYDPFYGTAEHCLGHLGPVGDYNGDGKDDIMCVDTVGFASQNRPGSLFSYSTGSGFSSVFAAACGGETIIGSVPECVAPPVSTG